MKLHLVLSAAMSILPIMQPLAASIHGDSTARGMNNEPPAAAISTQQPSYYELTENSMTVRQTATHNRSDFTVILQANHRIAQAMDVDLQYRPGASFSIRFHAEIHEGFDELCFSTMPNLEDNCQRPTALPIDLHFAAVLRLRLSVINAFDNVKAMASLIAECSQTKELHTLRSRLEDVTTFGNAPSRKIWTYLRAVTIVAVFVAAIVVAAAVKWRRQKRADDQRFLMLGDDSYKANCFFKTTVNFV